MNYDYSICGIHIRCQVPFPVTVTEESAPFISEFDIPDILFTFSPVDFLSMPDTSGVWLDDTCYFGPEHGYSVFYCPVRSQPPYAQVFYDPADRNHLICRYVSGMEHMLSYSHNLLDLLGMETLLLKFHACILHASYIKWKGRGILFSAPSGTGKSTQAELWQAYRGAEIINGDRAGLILRNGTWYAWGLPCAGSSGIYRNEFSELSALVFLRQAPYNKLYRLSLTQAIRHILPEISIHRWDESFVHRSMDVIEKLLFQVPVYLLECLPDEDAVQILEAEILREVDFDGTDSC